MALSDLTTAQLERLLELVKEKEAIQAQIAAVNNSMKAVAAGAPVTSQTHEKIQAVRPGRRRRGALKAGVLAQLQAASKAGLTVKELAVTLKAKPASVSVWFYTTGKNIKVIKKVGPARYAYQGGKG